MKFIKLTKGKTAIVDDEDFPKLNTFKWYTNTNGYACRSRKVSETKGNKHIFLHREVFKILEGLIIDHINMNKCDNRKENLRAVTYTQNRYNVKAKKTNRSGLKGVYWHSVDKAWRATICIDGKNKTLGNFDDKFEAARKYDRAAIRSFGLFARVNIYNY